MLVCAKCGAQLRECCDIFELRNEGQPDEYVLCGECVKEESAE